MAYTTINKPDTYFNTKLYTGTGATQSITGVGFQPDLVWIKNRSAIEDHFWYDAVRGISKLLKCNLSDAEATTSTVDLFNSFDSDGFTIGNSSGINGNGNNIVSWNFKAGGTAVSNTDGSITSSVSANQTAGFSIVSYTGNGVSGATIGHGLGNTPKIVITKNRSNAVDWFYFTTAIDGSLDYLILNTTDAKGDSIATAPNSSVFYATSAAGINTNGDNYIAYCFAEIKGFSKFGSYVGNGSADGPFIYTGFKPAMIITKKTSVSGDNWQIRDNKRDTYNEANRLLKPNASTAEQTTDAMDYYSNGFKWRNSAGEVNASGATFIYMAFAENPLVTTSGVPATAR